MHERITVLFPITDLARDGAQRQLLELVKGLDKERFEPIVLTLLPGGALEKEFSEVPGLELISLERKGKYDFTGLLIISRLLRRMQVDVVQPFLTPATLFGLLPAILYRTPVKIVTERSGPVKRNGHLGYRLYLNAEDFLTRFADWAIPNSQAGREYLVQRGINPDRIRVIYNGINLSRLNADKGDVERVRRRLGVPVGGKVVGMMARLFPVKNHAIFLQAAAMVSEAMADTRFAILGDGPLRGYLEKLSADLGLSSKVTFFGEQPDVGTYLAAFDVAAHTSETEGCSNSLLEAMALGKPVVATDVGGNREVVQPGETGLLVTPGDATAVAEAIITLLQNTQATKVMGQRAKERAVAQFDMRSIVVQYQSLWEKTFREKAKRKKSLVTERSSAQKILLLCTRAKVTHSSLERISKLLDGTIDWEYLLKLAAFHGVTPLLANNLTANGFSARIPQPYLSWLKQEYDASLHRNSAYSAEIERILSGFNKRKIRAIELKGIVLAESLYGNSELRTMYDIDILVLRQHLSSAEAYLTEQGYRRSNDSHPFHVTYLKAGSFPLEVELHWALVDSRLVVFPHQEIWDRAEPLLFHGVPTLTLSPKDNILYLAYHVTKHYDHLLKLLNDIAELLKKYEGPFDWDYIIESARSWQIETAVYYSLRRSKDLLEAPVPASVLETLRPKTWRWWLIDLLLSEETFVSPIRWKRLGTETAVLGRSLMVRGTQRMLAVLSRHRESVKRGAWLRTMAWVALSLGAALIRRWTRFAHRSGFNDW